MACVITDPIEHYFQVSSLHRIRVLEAGNPSGPCVLFVHGGPGSGVNTDWIDYIDCTHFRVILIDQRGAGKSRPLGELKENTLPDLIADIETVRKHLNVENWYVTGGSWGSVVALAYAIEHPKTVLGLVLRGVFLGTESEINWLYAPNGAARFYPDVWELFTLGGTLTTKNEIFKYYSDVLAETNTENSARQKANHTAPSKNVGPASSATLSTTQFEAAYRWMAWASISMSPLPPFNQLSIEELKKLYAKARIMCHFLSQECFLPSSNFLLEQVHSLSSTPIWLVQGRQDLICPPQVVWQLSQRHGNSEVHYLEGVGHAPANLRVREELRDIFKDIQRQS